MNERIRELARQAWKEAYNVDPADPRIARAHKAMEEGMEKFAELIVRECAEQIKTQGISASSEDYGDYEIGFNAGLFHALRTTKEHFGVEE
jgi:hypothetical protein